MFASLGVSGETLFVDLVPTGSHGHLSENSGGEERLEVVPGSSNSDPGWPFCGLKPGWQEPTYLFAPLAALELASPSMLAPGLFLLGIRIWMGHQLSFGDTCLAPGEPQVSCSVAETQVGLGHCWTPVTIQ